MSMIKKAVVWGVRGSFPMTGTNFMEYGGNTSCISVHYDERLVIFDAGSGLSELGEYLARTGQKRADILVSHLHMDHCLGLFSFRLFHDPEAHIHLYGSAHDNMGFRESLERLVNTPYWPLALKDFPARIHIHEIIPGKSFCLAGDEDVMGSPVIHTLPGNHPNQSLLYRLDIGDKSVIYALDCELDEKTRSSLTEFARSGDLLVWDASFTEDDLSRCKGWGHSTWKEGIALGRAAGVRKVLMTHYASSYEDSFLRQQEKLAAQCDPISLFAKEGMEINLYRNAHYCNMGGKV